MRKARYTLGFALVMALSLYLLPALQAADEPVPDSPEVTNLLEQARTHANRLKKDADTMHKFSLSRLSWESHADQIEIIKTHANNLGKVLQKLSDKHESASPWQQKAIDHITPLAAELASNIETTINHIGENQSRLHTPEYRDYLEANYELSSSLAGLINDYVAYGKSKAKYQKFGTSLAVPGH